MACSGAVANSQSPEEMFATLNQLGGGEMEPLMNMMMQVGLFYSEKDNILVLAAIWIFASIHSRGTVQFEQTRLLYIPYLI